MIADAIIYFGGAMALSLLFQLPIIVKNKDRKKLIISCCIMDLILAILLVFGLAALVSLGYETFFHYIILVTCLYVIIEPIILFVLCKKFNVTHKVLKIILTLVYPIILLGNQLIRIIYVNS